MKTKRMVFAVAFLVGLFVTGAVAQHEEHHKDQAAQPANKTDTGKTDGMMGMMSQMTSHHQQMSERMNKLMDSMAAIQSEKDPAALKAKLTEHKALLKEMHAAMKQQGVAMQGMSGMMMESCPMTGADAKPSTD